MVTSWWWTEPSSQDREAVEQGSTRLLDPSEMGVYNVDTFEENFYGSRHP
jgi:hypothetical protein